MHANYYLIEWHKGRNNIRNLNHFSYLCVFIFNRNRMDAEKKETKEIKDEEETNKTNQEIINLALNRPIR